MTDLATHSATHNAQEQRKNYRVKNKFQDKIILEIVVVTFIFINTLIILSFFTLQYFSSLQSFKYMLLSALAIGEISGLLMIYFYTLRVSHRVAGPIFNFERTFRRLAEGDFSCQSRLRANDYFHDTNEMLNECTESLRKRIADIQETAQELNKSVRENDSRSVALSEKLIAQVHAFQTVPERNN